VTPARFAGVEDLERIANQAQAKQWPVAVAIGQVVHVDEVTDTRIVTAAGTLVWSEVGGHWYMAWVAVGYTRSDKGAEVPVPPCTNLNGLPMTRAQASLVALHEMARSGCTRVYLPRPAGGA
jgi:hypothetical protein